MPIKHITFSYGHRAWNGSAKCKHMHGHNGEVLIKYEGDETNISQLESFINSYVNNKFILDLSDPWFNNIVNLEPIWKPAPEKGDNKPVLCGFIPRKPLNTTNETELGIVNIYAKELTQPIAWFGYAVDVKSMSGVERDFYESFLFITFSPTASLLAKWIYNFVKLLNVQVSRVDWYQSDEISGCYFEENK